MYRCACSLRALEIFVKDFAGLSIKSPRSRIGPSQRHAFSTRFPSRQLAFSTAHTEQINDTLPPPLNAPDTVRHEHSSLRSLDEAWNSNDNIYLSKDEGEVESERGHEEFAAVEDVALQAEGPAMQSMARKMKRLEKKRKRQAEGTWAPWKKERQERGTGKARERDSAKGAEEPDRRVRIRTVDEKVQSEATKSPKGKKRTETSQVAPRSKKERTRGTSTARESDYKSAEAKQRMQHPERTAKTPRTRRERVRTDLRGGRDETKSAETTRREIPTRKTFGAKTSTGLQFKASKEHKATSRPKTKDREVWQVQKASLERKFGEKGWQPSKRLSPDTIEGIRALHASDLANYKTETLAKHFQITPEAIRRILKSKWRPNEEEAEDRRQRWEKRGVKKWTEMAELGMRPPAKWRALGVTSKEQQERRETGRRNRKRADVLWDGGDGVADSESFAERIP